MKDKKNNLPKKPSQMTPEEFKSWAAKELKKCMEVQSFKIEQQQFSILQKKKKSEDT